MEGKLQKVRPPFEKSNRHNIGIVSYRGISAIAGGKQRGTEDRISYQRAQESMYFRGPYRKGFSASPSPTLRTGLILISLRFKLLAHRKFQDSACLTSRPHHGGERDHRESIRAFLSHAQGGKLYMFSAFLSVYALVVLVLSAIIRSVFKPRTATPAPAMLLKGRLDQGSNPGLPNE
jgi:hypothetical protein